MPIDPKDLSHLRATLGPVGSSMNEETFAAIAKKLHELAEHQTPTSDHVAEVLREQLGDSLGNDFMLDNSDLNSVLKDLRKKLENQTGEG